MDKMAVESFYYDCRLRNLREATLKCYADRLYYLAAYAKRIGKTILDLTTDDLRRYISEQIGRVSDETINGRIRVFKVAYKYMVQEGFCDHDPTERLRLLKVEHKVKPVVTPQQLKLLLSTCDRSFVGLRDRAIIMTLYDSMIRRKELVGLDITDCDLRGFSLHIRNTKNHHERYVPLSPATAKAIHLYQVKYRMDVPGEALFSYQNGDRMRAEHVRLDLYRRGLKVNMKVHPHLLRHSGATEYLRAGGSPYILQKILGHSSPITTQIYVHLDKDDMVAGHERYSPVNRL